MVYYSILVNVRNVYYIIIILHETSLMSQFLHVEFYTPLCRVQAVLQIGENQKSILFFYPKL